MKQVLKVVAASLASVSLLIKPASAFSVSVGNSVSKLLEENGEKISALKSAAQKYDDAPTDDLFYLRYCLNSVDDEVSLSKLESNMKWRNGEGKFICDAAKSAVEEATSGSNWDNAPVRDMAPHASIVNKYIGTTQCLTTTTRNGDLCYCIRAGKIDDVALMSELTVEEMTDFFLYCKEVNAVVANMRSLETDRIVKVLVANDLSGVKLVGGDATFRKALSVASTKANELYPELSGATLLLNLPKLLGALVKLFTPLFPKEVRQKIKFEQGPLKKVKDLVEISPAGKTMDGGKARDDFLNYLDELVYSE